MVISIWNSVMEIGYEQKTSFWMDFSIADRFGDSAILDTYKRAFKEWKSEYEYLTELVLVLNRKCWEWYDKGNQKRSELYSDLYYKASSYAMNHLKGEELDYYFNVTD